MGEGAGEEGVAAGTQENQYDEEHRKTTELKKETMGHQDHDLFEQLEEERQAGESRAKELDERELAIISVPKEKIEAQKKGGRGEEDSR